MRRDTCGMPIRPLSSPSHDRLHTPKQEPVSASVSSPSNKIRHSSSKHKKQLQHEKRSSSKVSAAAEEFDNVTAALTWKEQLGQILAILVVATLVYYSTSVTIQWLQEASKPFCDDKESPQVMVSGMIVLLLLFFVNCLLSREEEEEEEEEEERILFLSFLRVCFFLDHT